MIGRAGQIHEAESVPEPARCPVARSSSKPSKKRPVVNHDNSRLQKSVHGTGNFLILVSADCERNAGNIAIFKFHFFTYLWLGRSLSPSLSSDAYGIAGGRHKKRRSLTPGGALACPPKSYEDFFAELQLGLSSHASIMSPLLIPLCLCSWPEVS